MHFSPVKPYHTIPPPPTIAIKIRPLLLKYNVRPKWRSRAEEPTPDFFSKWLRLLIFSQTALAPGIFF